MEDDLLQGATRSGATKRGYSRRYFATFQELKAAHRRVFGAPSLFLVGAYAVCVCVCGRELRLDLFSERPATDRSLGLAEAVLRLPHDHPNPRQVLVKAFAKLFGLYSVDKNQPSFDCSLTANLVLVHEKTGQFCFYFGQDHGKSEGVESLSLSTIYRVDSLSDVKNIPNAVTTDEFADAFSQIYQDTSTRVDSIAAVVYIIRLILPDFRKHSVVGSKLTRLF
jgi:hypothetical protein